MFMIERVCFQCLLAACRGIAPNAGATGRQSESGTVSPVDLVKHARYNANLVQAILFRRTISQMA